MSPYPEDEAPLIPGVDYDILTEEEMAEERAKPEPLAAEYQAGIIAKYGTPVGGDPADRSPVSEEQIARTNKKLLERIESGKPLSG